MKRCCFTLSSGYLATWRGRDCSLVQGRASSRDDGYRRRVAHHLVRLGRRRGMTATVAAGVNGGLIVIRFTEITLSTWVDMNDD